MTNYLNIIIIIVIIYIAYMSINNYNSSDKHTIDNFTQNEMKNYQATIKTNCDYTTDLNNKLKKNNNDRCNNQGNTYRETINNKRLCWDDVSKEIVTGFDKESNCGLLEDNSNTPPLDPTTTPPANTPPANTPPANTPPANTPPLDPTNNTIEEGPNFINTNYMGLFESIKGINYSDLNLDNGRTNNYANTDSYTDIGFTTDPSFLARLSAHK